LPHELTNIKELQQRIALYEDMKAYQALYELLAAVEKLLFFFRKIKRGSRRNRFDVFIKLCR